MKIKSIALLTLLTLLTPAFAADAPHHDHTHAKKMAGPNQGRVITAIEPHLEFLVTQDRKIQLVALTEDLKASPLSGQIVSITAGERSHPTKMELQEENGKLVSKNPLPAGNGFPVSISIKASAESKPVYERFNLNLTTCPECQQPEYACLCAH